MPTYILLTKLSPELTKKIKDRLEIGRTWLKQINDKCPKVKFVSHYALLGPYDFLDIFEAPDEEEAAKVAMISLATSAVQSESWTAIPYKRFIKLTKEL